MQMDKKNCAGCQDEPKLSAEGIRFEPTAAVKPEPSLENVSVTSLSSIRAEAIAELEGNPAR